MRTDVIIIGAGASGLAAGIMAARQGASVCILERMDQPGKKILATGNGRCNYTNKYLDAACYRSQAPQFVTEVLRDYDFDRIVSFFESLGIMPRVKEGGYCYPNSLQASAILQVLVREAHQLGIQLICKEAVQSIKKTKSGFLVSASTKQYQAKKVILAAGGRAYPKLGSDGSGYDLARQLGHKITPVWPALCGLRCKGRFFKQVFGVRVQSEVTLMDEQGDVLASDQGELQLTNYGISGIPVFQVSRYAGEALLKKQKVMASIDFMPEMDADAWLHALQMRRTLLASHPCSELLVGVLPEKLIPLMLTASAIDADRIIGTLEDADLEKLRLRTKAFRMEVLETMSFDEAQVCAGGVCTHEIDPVTMMSKLVADLYVTGELLDVDGMCGGYNLHFAWTTGLRAGMAAGKAI